MKKLARVGVLLAIVGVAAGAWLWYSGLRAPEAWAGGCTDAAPYGKELLQDASGDCFAGWGGG